LLNIWRRSNFLSINSNSITITFFFIMLDYRLALPYDRDKWKGSGKFCSFVVMTACSRKFGKSWVFYCLMTAFRKWILRENLEIQYCMQCDVVWHKLRIRATYLYGCARLMVYPRHSYVLQIRIHMEKCMIGQGWVLRACTKCSALTWALKVQKNIARYQICL
jgi:hypothetical protein